jgi:hypothetical protein
MPQLQDIDVQWVSIVDRAAVRDPQNKSEPRRFLLWKGEGVTPPEDTTTGKEGGPVPQQTPEELQAALTKAEEARAAAETAHKAELEKRDQEHKAELEKAQKERDEALAKAGKKPGEGEAEDGDEDDLNKADLPPEVRARIEKAERDATARIEKAEQAAQEATELAKAEREQRVTREFVAKAETLPHLPQKPGEFGPVLKSASEKLTKEEYDELDRVLKAANEQIERGSLFKELGGAGGPGPGAGTDAFSEVQRKAEELRKADSSLSPERALQKAMESDPELQARYAAEQRGV